MALENGGAANPDGTQPQGAGGGDPNPNPNPNPGGQSGVGGPGGGENKFSYKEDRSDWVPRSRLNETTASITKKFQAQVDQLTGQLTEHTTRVRRALGVEDEDPAAKEKNQIKEAILEIFPNLKNLEGLTEEKLTQILSAAEAATETTEAQWTRHADTMIGYLEDEVADALGVDKLSDTQKRRLVSAYREEAQAAFAARKAAIERGEKPIANDFLARHEKGDKTLIKEFAKAFLDDWYEPARRSVTQRTVQRSTRPVPRGERTRQPMAQTAPEIDYNDPKAFKEAMIKARQGGGTA